MCLAHSFLGPHLRLCSFFVMAAMAEAAFVRFAYPLPKAGCEPKEQKAALKASLMFRKLVNKSISREHSINSTARQTARKAAGVALQCWYDKAFHRVDSYLIPQRQQNRNLQIVAGMTEFLQRRGYRNGYIMLCSLFDSTPKPMIVKLDDTGGVTFRQLHQQIRKWLDLPMKASLRMCSARPWLRHLKNTDPVSEAAAFGASDARCTKLLGTTILYYNYVHLREIPTIETRPRIDYAPFDEGLGTDDDLPPLEEIEEID